MNRLPSALVASLMLAIVAAAPAAAQTARDARLLITVVDPSGAIVPGATVTVESQDAATAIRIAPATTTDRGLATIDGLLPGRGGFVRDYRRVLARFSDAKNSGVVRVECHFECHCTGKIRKRTPADERIR